MARQQRFDQQKRRRYTKFRDQHDRRWGGEIEKESGDPCYELQPEGWSAPIMPPSPYVRVVRLEMGLVEIAYDEWITDLTNRRQEWRDQVETYCHGMYGEKAGEILDAERSGGGLPPSLLRLVGPPPLSDGPVKACKAENRWALGFSDKRPPWADEYPDWPFNRKAAPDELAKFRDEGGAVPRARQAPEPSAEDVQAFLDDMDEDEGMLDGGEDGGESLAASAANAGEEKQGGRRSKGRSARHTG